MSWLIHINDAKLWLTGPILGSKKQFHLTQSGTVTSSSDQD